MRGLLVVLVVGSLAGAGCRTGGGVPAASPAVSYETHMAEAARLEEEAARHEHAAEVARQKGATYECDTAPESEQATSGGERFHGTRICDDVAASDRRRHEREARGLRQEADRHRGQARSLLDAERAACAGYGVEALRDTPIGRARDGARVVPIDGGVQVTIDAGGAGLEAVRRELACHRARAALYEAGGYMPHDPALVPATRVAVEAAPGGAVIVTVRGDDGAAVAVARERAAALGGAR